MTPAERTALALLRCGRSFAEAAQASGIPAAELMELWRREDARGHAGLAAPAPGRDQANLPTED